MSIKCVLCLDFKDRGIMHEGAEIALPWIGDVLARGSAMGELGEYLKAISLISQIARWLWQADYTFIL